VAPTTKKPRFTRPVAAVESKYYYYKFFDEALSWSEADDFCTTAGGYLGIIREDFTNEAIWTEAQDRGFGAYWIGGSRVSTQNIDAGFEWSSSTVPFGRGLPDSDGNGVNDLWANREPNNFKNKESCVRVGKANDMAAGAKWNDARCGDRNPFVCSFIVSTTSSTALPTTTTTAEPTTTTTEAPTTTTAGPTTTTSPPPYSGYPEGWQYFEGCWFGSFSVKKTYTEAVSACAAVPEGATLASPQTEEAAMFIYELESRRGRPRWLSGSVSATGGFEAGGPNGHDAVSPGYPPKLER
jgi:hypothetical protein